MSTNVVKWNLQRLFTEVICDHSTCINWCKANELLPVLQTCPEGHSMSLHEPNKKTKYGCGIGRFRCYKKHTTVKRDISISMCKNTLFQNAKLPLEKMLLMTYCFVCCDFSQSESIHESSILGGKTSTGTMCEWYIYCRELITNYFLKHKECSEKLGGKGIVIEVAEWKFNELKFGEQKFCGELNSEMWALGIVETNSRHFHVALCPDNKRDHRTLFEIIEEHVAPETTIVIKNSKAYQCISKNYNFTDETLNCDQTGDNDNPEPIMPTRSSLSLNAGNRIDISYGHYALEYLWRQEITRNSEDVFESFLQIVRSLYPV